MTVRRYVFFVLLPVLTFCSSRKIDMMPGSEYYPAAAYHSLKIKADIKELSSGRKQSIKILLKFTEAKARMLFLGAPLNKVYAKLIIDEEFSLLINSKKKKYWQGDFKNLLLEMWDMDFNYLEFKNLLENGIIPKKRAKESGLKIIVKKEKVGGKPGEIRISGKNYEILFKISGRSIKKGNISFAVNLENMAQVYSLTELLESE